MIKSARKLVVEPPVTVDLSSLQLLFMTSLTSLFFLPRSSPHENVVGQLTRGPIFRNLLPSGLCIFPM